LCGRRIEWRAMEKSPGLWDGDVHAELCVDRAERTTLENAG
jgi:hypothetical protein